MESDKKEVSEKYLLKAEETYARSTEFKKGRLKHGSFYLLILFFICINFLSSSSFEIRSFKFNGFKDWGGSITLLVLEVIFLFIYGARCQITHLEIFLDKICSFSPINKNKN